MIIAVAANYVRRSSAKPQAEQKTVAVRHARLFGQLLPIIETFVRAPNEDANVIVLSDKLKALS